MSSKASKCSLCTDGKLWNDRNEYINHLSTFHLILRAKDFAEVVESLQNNRIEEKENDVKCPKLDSKGQQLTAEGQQLDLKEQQLDSENHQGDSEGQQFNSKANQLNAEGQQLDSEGHQGDSEGQQSNAEGQRWRCIRFKCRECGFPSHNLSNLKKHQKKKNHFGSIQTEEMKVILRSSRYKFAVGDLVLAKMEGYPFWPGIIDMLPDIENVTEFVMNRHYRVRFFEKSKTSFALISEDNITKYKKTDFPPKAKKSKTAGLKAAITWAEYVLDWSPDERNSYFHNEDNQSHPEPEPNTVEPEEDEVEGLVEERGDPTKQLEIENIFGNAGLRYEVGDLVLAKMDGYPFWPGIIHSIPEKANIYDFVVQRHYSVRFFEEKTTSFGNVPEKNIKKFEENMLETASKKPKQLAEAFAWAEYVLNWTQEDRTVYFNGETMDI